MVKPEQMNEKTQRRQQIEKYLEKNPEHKPKDLLDWLKSQDPNPWPTCSINGLGKIMRRIRKCPSQKPISVCLGVQSCEIMPLEIKWDMKIPVDSNVHKLRRVQLSWYLDEYPTHKPKQVLGQFGRHNQNPKPDCTAKKLSRLIKELQKLYTYPAEYAGTMPKITHVMCENFESILLQWNMKMPRNVNVLRMEKVAAGTVLQPTPAS